MRDRDQIEMSPSGYRDAKQQERQKHLVQLLTILSRSHDEPWYIWVRNRSLGIHDHEAVMANGKPAACPVPGCRRVQ